MSPRLRAEQIQDYSIKDLQVAINAAILQSKIANQDTDPTGWITKGTVNPVATAPVWDGTQAGRIYYVTSTEELLLGIATDPYFVAIGNSGLEGWNGSITVRSGAEATNWDGTHGTMYAVSAGVTFPTDSSTLFVYLNGALQQHDPDNGSAADYRCENDHTIEFPGASLTAADKVTMVVYQNAALSNYATKAWTQSQITASIFDGGTIHSSITPSTTMVNLGDTSHKFGNVWAQTGHFDASTIYLGDTAQVKVNAGKLQFTTDGTAWTDLPAAAELTGFTAATIAGALNELKAEKIILSSISSSVIPGTTNSYSLGDATHTFQKAYFSDGIYFRPVGGSDEARIYRNLTGEATEMHFQIAADADDRIVFENGTSALLTVTGDGNVTIPGNLTVSGTTTTISSQNVTVSDAELTLNFAAPGINPIAETGIRVRRAKNSTEGDRDAKILWNEADAKWQVSDGAATTDILTSNYAASGSTTIHSTGGGVFLQDSHLSAPLSLSQSGAAALVGYTATSIVGALNEVKASSIRPASAITFIDPNNPAMYTNITADLPIAAGRDYHFPDIGSSGTILVAGSAAHAGSFDTSAGTPNQINRLNYNGMLHATTFYGDATAGFVGNLVGNVNAGTITATNTIVGSITGSASNATLIGSRLGNGLFDSDTVGQTPALWNRYFDQPAIQPVNGAGTWQTNDSTFLVNNVNPMFGSNDAIFTTPSAMAGSWTGSTVGMGVSTDFTLEPGALSTVQTISFYYKTGGAYTSVAGNTSVGVYVYDIDNSAVILPSVVNLPASTAPVQFSAAFSPTSGTHYRLILHTQVNNGTSPYTLKVDKVCVGENLKVNTPLISAWRSFPMVIGATTTAPTKGAVLNDTAQWRQVGSDMEIIYNLAWNGVGGAGSGTYLFYLPEIVAGSGVRYTVDVAKLTSISGDTSNFPVGVGYVVMAGATPAEVSVKPSYSTSALVLLSTNTGAWSAFAETANNYNQMSNANGQYRFTAKVPIAQWTNSVNLATDWTEYAYNSDVTSTASVTGSGFAYGLAGIAIPSTWSTAATTYTRRTKFTRPVQPTDKILLEVQNNAVLGIWDESMWIFPFAGANNHSYGMRWVPVAGDLYSVDVIFSDYGASAGGAATYGVQAALWSTNTGYSWRVRKISNGNMAEVSANTQFGRTAGDGTSGYVMYNGTTRTVGQFDGGATPPNDSSKSLNFNGNLWATNHVGGFNQGSNNFTVSTTGAFDVSITSGRNASINSTNSTVALTIKDTWNTASSTGPGVLINSSNQLAGGTGGNVQITTTAAAGTPGNISINSANAGATSISLTAAANGTIQLTTSGTGATQVAGALIAQGALVAQGSFGVTGTTQLSGRFDAGTTAPAHYTRLNYDGSLYSTALVIGDGPNPSTPILWVRKGLTQGTMPTTLTAANSYIQLGGSETHPTNPAYVAIGFGFVGGGVNSPAYIAFAEQSVAGYTNGDLQFYTRSVTTDTAPTKRFEITGAGAVNTIATAASTWTHSGGAWALTSASQNVTISTTASGVITLTSAGALNLTGAAASLWTVTAGGLTINSTGAALALTTTTSGNITLTSAGAITLAAAAGGAINLTSHGASTWTHDTGAWTLNSTSQAVAINTLTSGAITLSAAGGSNINLTIASTGIVSTNANIVPTVNKTNDLGTSTLAWRSLYLPTNTDYTTAGGIYFAPVGTGTPNDVARIYGVANAGVTEIRVNIAAEADDAFIIESGAAAKTTAFKVAGDGTVTIGGATTINGNLTVAGTLTYTNTTTETLVPQQQIWNYAAVGANPAYAAPAYNNITTPALRIRQLKTTNEGDRDAWIGWDSGKSRWFVSNGDNAERLIVQANDIVAAGAAAIANASLALLYNGNGAQGAAGVFDSFTTNPASTQRLNYNGDLYATDFYSTNYKSWGAINLSGSAASLWSVAAGGLTVNSTSAILALQTTTSGNITAAPASGSSFTVTTAGVGAISLTSANAINHTSAAASTWTHSVGAWALNSTSQPVTISTITSGTIALTSAGALNLTGAAASLITATAGGLTINSTSAALTLQTTTSGAVAITPASGSNATITTAGAGVISLTSANAINHTSAAASTWTHSGGAWGLNSTGQPISLTTINNNSGTPLTIKENLTSAVAGNGILITTASTIAGATGGNIVISTAASAGTAGNIQLTPASGQNVTITTAGVGKTVSAGNFQVTGGTAGVAGTFNATGTLPLNTNLTQLNYEGSLYATQFVLGTTSPAAPTAGAIYGGAVAPTSNQQVNVNGNLYATQVYNAVYNDLAEFMEMDPSDEAQPGDVLVQTENGLRRSEGYADARVIGVYSDTFGYALGAADMDKKYPIGLAGVVPVKVREPLKIGDLLVSAAGGFATKLVEKPVPGTVLGKVMQTKTDGEVSRIKMLILHI